MNCTIINTYDELIEKIKEVTSKSVKLCDEYRTDFYYRGHANKDWQLVPTLLRDNNAQEDKELSEILGIDDKDKSRISLAVAQHYGRKTRCLDFTRNYNVALYFACKPDSSDYDKDGAIFIIDKYYHLPDWFTNYLVYYVATDNRKDVSAWDYAEEMLDKKEIVDEFKRTGRSLEKDDVQCEIQWFLSKGFMVDFRNNDFGIERIKKQEAALYYFGSKFYSITESGRDYPDVEYLKKYWSNQNMFHIDLHNLSNPRLEDDVFCTKIIIAQRLKKEIFEKIGIKAIDLGL